MNMPAPRIHPPTPARFFATFGYAWFVIGLFTGTVVLVFGVRGMLKIIQSFGWGQSAQNRILIGFILLFIVLSFMLARRVVKALYRHSARTRKIALAGLAVPALASMYAWSNPQRFLVSFAGATPTGSVQMAGGGPTFLFGAYPDDARIRQLKQEGVGTIVSLQDPRVLVELQGINEERKSAERAGIKLVQAPMLPWVSDNSASIALIRNLAVSGKGTYYVHCGLGRDRVNIARRVIESVAAPVTVAATSDLKNAEGFEKRTTPFGRGRLVRLAAQVWLIPMPNDAEFYAHIIQGVPGHVFLLLNPADETQAAWMLKAQREMKQYSITSTLIPTSAGDTVARAIKSSDTTAGALSALIAKVRAQREPYTIVVLSTTLAPQAPTQPLVRAFLRSFGASGVASRAATKASADVPAAR